jgi:hypothetical protein
MNLKKAQQQDRKVMFTRNGDHEEDKDSVNSMVMNDGRDGKAQLIAVEYMNQNG